MGAPLQEVFAELGRLGVTGAAAAAAAFGLFKWLGHKWVDARLAKELEAFKAEKAEQREALNRDFQREADRLKAEVARLTDRATQLHKREYEALPDAWGLLNKAFGRATEAMRSGEIYPHFDPDDRAALEHFIDGEDLADHQKAQLKVSPNWYGDYAKMRRSRAVIEARVVIRDFSNYVILNGVFFEEPLLVKMRKANALIERANEARWAVLEEINEPTAEVEAKANLAQAAALVEEIKCMVRAKLFETALQPAS